MSRLFLFCVFLFSLPLAPCSLLLAQPVADDLPQITGCIALINARVVSAPGKAPVVSTVIIRDGLITQVGTEVKIPGDAYRVLADSFYVYPAFIDAFSSTGIRESEGEGGQQGQGNKGGQKQTFDAEGNLPLEDAGITPYKSVRTSFDPGDKSIADWRAQGFAISHVVPKGKMIPGMGSIIVLSGKNADQLLWKEDVSMYSQWTGAGGGYPQTVIGVMAKWRELYHNATLAVAHEASYNNATLVSRPIYNQAHQALMPVVKKEMSLWFRAPKVKDISRALAMQSDLGMKMVITDAEEAWYLEDKFKSGSIPLVLSLDLPEDKSEKKAEGAKDAKGHEGPGQDGPGQLGPKPAKDTSLINKDLKSPLGDLGAKEAEAANVDTVKVDPEKEAFEKKRAESLKAHQDQAGVLAKDGVAFSFGTMSVKSGDFSKNIATMIEHGLSEEKALSALTTQPAKLLGIEKYCGTVEIGKMANIIVSTKPLFDKDASIKYMIVEGNLYEYEIKEKKEKRKGKSEEAPAGILTGKWSYAIEAPDQKREGTFEFTNDGGELKGTMTSEDNASGNDQLSDIVIDGTSVSFTFDFDMGGQMIQLEFDLTLKGETFDGTVSVGDFGTFPITGNRTSKPN